MDKSSKIPNQEVWTSKFVQGNLKRGSDGTYSIEWSQETQLTSRFNEGGRGMELSELSFFNSKLYSVDDRTGILYDVSHSISIPSFILMDGNGDKDKGLKGEWSTVKDGKLYVGSIGKEWVADGVIKNTDPMWVKVIDRLGHIEHLYWKPTYDKLRMSTETTYPGYLLHEAVSWNPVNRKWYFLPRRVSKEEYDEALDEERCSNIMLIADEDFQHVTVKEIGPFNKLRGFSSFKFIPMREDEIVALKTQEKDETITFITVLNIKTGEVLMPETKIGNVKYEGIEFI